ncbi:MAG TPA: BTAD domain-containing putative transcriptional regulator [Acidimicrobiia bacterium]|nr:BTAD domain-containing putative transcriptional regulator [Acidimicrobiia bacterium]
MQFRILGGVGVLGDDGVTRTVTARRQRGLLAFLILHANRVVSSGALVDGLWGESLPDAPVAALQVVVSRLRATLGPSGTAIVAESGGYRLDVGPEETDLSVASAMLTDGRAALARHEPTHAVAAFERALSLWNGHALEDLTALPFARDAARRVRELWLSLAEARNDALLFDGRHLEVLPDVEGLLAAEPLREHLRAQQVAALYRAGRQVEAVRMCDTHRKALRDELGLAPSPAMVELERRVLTQDPTLLAADVGFMTPLPAWTSEFLPFVGRDFEFDEVLSRLAEAVETGMRFVLVDGDAGTGKSRFLLHIARRFARDAIVLPVHVRDVFNPALHAFARVLAEATLRISDEELRVIVDGLPDVPSDIARVRSVSESLVSGTPLRLMLRDEDLLAGGGRWIAALSGKAPVVLLVDDLDVAGTGLLHVIWQLAMLSSPKRVLVVASVRTADNHTPSMLAGTLSMLQGRGLLHRMTLPPLDEFEVAELLERMPGPSHTDSARDLYDVTGGSPFLIAETVCLRAHAGVDERDASMARICDVARRRLAELGQAAATLVEQASSFETDFTVDALAQAVGASVATVTMLVDQAVAAQVLRPSTLTSYCFVHRLFREALFADVRARQPAARRERARPEHNGARHDGGGQPH